jgi:MFS family permease
MKARVEKPTDMGRYPWYVLGILTLAQTCHGIDRAIIGLVLAPVGREFALTDGQLGMLAGFAYGIFFALATLPFGIAVDNWNRRNLMAAALTLWSGATALCGLATGFWTLVIGRAAVGTAEAGGSPTGMSLLSDYFGQDRRATAIGIWYLSSGIGLAIAFVVGGAIVQSVGWRWAFVAAGVPALLPGNRLLLLSSGTGLAPFLSLIRDPDVCERYERVIVVHSVRQASDLAFRAELESGLRDDPLVSEPAMAQLSYLPTVTREAFTCNARITTMIEDGSLFAQAGLSGAPLSVQTDRIMLCGGMAMIKDIAHLLDARGFIEGSNAKPGDYVIERAFVG